MRYNNLAHVSKFVAPHVPVKQLLDRDFSTHFGVAAQLIEIVPDGFDLRILDLDGVPFQVARVRLPEDRIVRVTLSSNASDIPVGDDVVSMVQLPEGAAEVTNADGVITAVRGRTKIRVDLRDLGLMIFDGDRRVCATLSGEDVDASGNALTQRWGTSADGQNVVQHISFAVGADDAFYGLGESFTPINKRGRNIAVWHTDTFGTGSQQMYKPVPYLYSTAGFGLIVNSAVPAEFDIAATSLDGLGVLCPERVLDMVFVVAPSAGEALQLTHKATGDLVMPPKWAFGGWLSTGFLPQTQVSVEEQLELIIENDFPADVIHIDPYWMKKGRWADLEWDPVAFPDPEGMLSRLRDHGLRTCLWIHPYISIDSPVHREAAEAGYFLRDASGGPWIGRTWGPNDGIPDMSIVDFTNEDASKWYQGKLRKLLQQGAAVFKTDFGEAVPEDCYTASGVSGRVLHNVYPLIYNDVVADVTEEVTGDRVVWGRSSYLGGHRHVAQWGGDTACTWQGMAHTIRGGLSYSLSGYSFWSHDVGGFYNAPTQELFRAWARWGVFAPLARLHGLSSRLPWEQEPETQRVIQDSFKLRYELLPYIYSQSIAATRQNLPLTAPAALDEVKEVGSRDCDSSYLLGADLLVAPERDESGEQLVYLPSGTWIEYGTGQAFAGGRWIRRTLSGDVPLFVRSGAVLPTAPGLRRVPAGPFEGVTLELWKPASGKTEVFDVDSASEVQVEVTGTTADVTVVGPLDVSDVKVKFASEITRVLVNGREMKAAGAGNFTK